MHASIVVLSALVAVATGQYWGRWGMMPINPALGVPFDEPAVMAGKMFNAQQHAIRGGLPVIFRKRREASPAPEAAAPAAEAAPAEHNPEKRQILAYSTLGLGYGLGYSGWGSPYYGWGSPYLWRKRRDTTETEHAADMEESNKEKRQIGYWGGWNAGLYSPYMRSWGGLYHGLPYLYRKRRDTSEQQEQPKTETAGYPAEGSSQQKRQVILGAYGWGYPSMYRSIYSPFLFRKRRDTDSQVAEEETKDDRDKRQLLLGAPLAYSAYTPYMMGAYPYGLRAWW